MRLRTACQRRGRDPFTRAGRTRASAAAAAAVLLGANPRRPHERAPLRVVMCLVLQRNRQRARVGKEKRGRKIVRALAHPVLTASSGVEVTYRLIKLNPVNEKKNPNNHAFIFSMRK